MLGLSKKDIYGIDLDNFAGVKIIPYKGFQFHTYENENENKLPFDNNTFDFITMQQVLHHVKKQSIMLKEIKRVLKPEGILFIREHDKKDNDSNIEDLIKLEHLLYSQLFDNIPYDIYEKTKYEKYFSKKSLFSKLKKLGFKILFQKYENNPTNYYNIIAQL